MGATEWIDAGLPSAVVLGGVESRSKMMKLFIALLLMVLVMVLALTSVWTEAKERYGLTQGLLLAAIGLEVLGLVCVGLATIGKGVVK